MSIKWVGLDKLERLLKGAPREVKQNAAAALKREGEKIMTISKQRFVPVDQGPLRASGFVDFPVVGRNRVSVTLGYGGAAKAYALIQHERMDLQHSRGGPKYLERPVNAAASEVSRAVARAVERSL